MSKGRGIKNTFFKTLLPVIFMMSIASCAGYRPVTRDNPLAAYGIQTLSIPMFYNHSTLPNVSHAFTSEIYYLMSSFPGLRVVNDGDGSRSDAVLIGIVESSDYYAKTVKTSAKRFTSGTLDSSIGERQGFYIPSRTEVALSLRLVLIQNPTEVDMDMISSRYFQPFLGHHPRVIFNQRMTLNSSFSRTIDPTTSPDDGGAVNFAKNQRLVSRSVEEMASSASHQFRDLVLNVF